MTEPTPPSDLEVEFDALMRRACVSVPEEWRAGTIRTYATFKRMLERTRQPRHCESEPASVFDPGRLLNER